MNARATEEFAQVKITRIARLIESHTFYLMISSVVIGLLLWENNALLRRLVNGNNT